MFGTLLRLLVDFMPLFFQLVEHAASVDGSLIISRAGEMSRQTDAVQGKYIYMYIAFHRLVPLLKYVSCIFVRYFAAR